MSGKNEQVKKELEKWIKNSDNTNEYCERSILSEAILELMQNDPDIPSALSRLFSLTDLNGSQMVVQPKIAMEIENGEV